MNTLYFTLGPVQGFVAWARRTRDFWAGSFILSYLAGHAILNVIKARGKILLPAVTINAEEGFHDPLLAAIQRHSEGSPVEKGPFIATLPNRFQAEIPAGYDPNQAVMAVQEAWSRLAAVVWTHFVAPVAHLGNGTRAIWERQLATFWETAWVIGNSKASDLLERRKNWRSQVPAVEPGDKCTLMGNRQELSGFIRIRQHRQQDRFWEALRQLAGELEIGEDERLCAVALVKRLFPLVAQEALGWRLPVHYPSTPYLAAVPWLAGILQTNPAGAASYAIKADSLLQTAGREDPGQFSRLAHFLADHPEAKGFSSLDGNCFFVNAMQNTSLWMKNKQKEMEQANPALELQKDLEQLGPPASPFYAMLKMDGDRMGALLQEYKPALVSTALARFSREVPRIIENHDGITVFAGGDDVLGLLPLDKALPAALELKETYTRSFEGIEGIYKAVNKGTISAAIVYTHYTTPLTVVYAEVCRLLDEVAKEDTGRDSLAVTVWKGAGRALIWAAPWQVIKEQEGAPDLITALVKAFQSCETGKGEFNNSFFYNLRSRLRILKDEGSLLSDLDAVELLIAEYLKNRERQCTKEEARERMKRLLRLCRRSWRDAEAKVHIAEGPLTLDGALLVKFLVQKGAI
ncbi:type III-B CRISPR-associated protein Cas10/Cmr2 [Moorella naiadis]|uniref:type III-B CRISPR-associated protein Cas10/Cmr2 n=1 Tax=Moorella naiadis (nom. illeg.) TaxID=3093670 RepID=UPI003D9CBCAE